MPTVENWDRQIRLFAQYFLCHSYLPRWPFTLLDVGCGTGAALGEIKRHYPYAGLFGCDFEMEHVEISRRMNGAHAHFYQADIRDVSDRYDIIYVSNILEHLTDWRPALEQLLSLCSRLYALVPYREILKKEQSGIPNVDHVASFHESTFDYLIGEDFSIEMRVIRTPYAWGHPLKREVGLRIKAALNGESFEVQRELLVSLTNVRKVSSLFGKPFYGRPRALINTLKIS